MKIFVTGGGGFLGFAIVQRLLANGHDVFSFSRGDHQALKKIGVTHIQGDISKYKSLKEAMKGCEAVFHIAAKTGIWGKYKDYYKANVTGTENVLQACRELNIHYLVFSSTPSVVFNGKDSEGNNESMPYPGKYYAYYPKTKAIAEKLVMSANSHSFKTVSLRPQWIWGPGDTHYLPRLFKKARTGKLLIIGSSPKKIDCTYIDNAAGAHIQAFNQLLDDPAKVEGKTYFISQGHPIAISELINKLIATGGFPPVTKSLSPGIARFAGRLLETIYRISGINSEPAITYFLAQQLSTSHWHDISAAQNDFGYKIEISLDKGMEQLQEWVSNNSK